MNTHSRRIGEGSEDHAVPANRLSLRDIVAEYDTKRAAIPALVAGYHDAVANVEAASSIGGAFGGTVWATRGSLYERDVEKALLVSAWRHVMNGLNIQQIASAKDRAALERNIESPPAFTLEAIKEMFGPYLLDPRYHVLKGLAECFADLDPAYRSHEKVKIGVAGLPKRIIVSSVGDAWSTSWGAEKVRDVCNALLAFRGEPHMERRAFADMLGEAKRHGEADFCGGRLKRFQNGNAHLIFDKWGLRDINCALAEFYGDVLPDAPSERDVRKRPSTEVAKDLQFYPTPPAVAEELIRRLHLRGGETILEPSCGEGALLDALAGLGSRIDHLAISTPVRALGIEYSPERAEIARSKGYSVQCRNFLDVPPAPDFDCVLMNPPFYGRHYAKHIRHAIGFLKPGGSLVSVLPASAWYDHGELDDLRSPSWGRYRHSDSWTDLPMGSFTESGTNIATGIFVYTKPK